MLQAMACIELLCCNRNSQTQTIREPQVPRCLRFQRCKAIARVVSPGQPIQHVLKLETPMRALTRPPALTCMFNDRHSTMAA